MVRPRLGPKLPREIHGNSAVLGIVERAPAGNSGIGREKLPTLVGEPPASVIKFQTTGRRRAPIFSSRRRALSGDRNQTRRRECRLGLDRLPRRL